MYSCMPFVWSYFSHPPPHPPWSRPLKPWRPEPCVPVALVMDICLCFIFSIHLMSRGCAAYYSSHSHISRSGDLVYCHFASQVESYFLLIYGLLRRKNRKTFIRLDLQASGTSLATCVNQVQNISLAHHSKWKPGWKETVETSAKPSPAYQNEQDKKFACPCNFTVLNNYNYYMMNNPQEWQIPASSTIAVRLYNWRTALLPVITQGM